MSWSKILLWGSASKLWKPFWYDYITYNVGRVTLDIKSFSHLSLAPFSLKSKALAFCRHTDGSNTSTYTALIWTHYSACFSARASTLQLVTIQAVDWQQRKWTAIFNNLFSFLFFFPCPQWSNQNTYLGKSSKEKNGNLMVFYQYWGAGGGAVTPRPIYFRFFPEEKHLYLRNDLYAQKHVKS